MERIFEHLYVSPEQWIPTTVGLLEADGYYWWCSTGRILLDTPWPVFQDLFAQLLHLNENFDSVAKARNTGAVTFPGYSDPETCKAWIV